MSDREGERHDGDGRTQPAVRHIRGATRAYAPGVLELDMCSATGVLTPYYQWVDVNGKLRIGTTYPAETLGGNTSGTVVGAQTA